MKSPTHLLRQWVQRRRQRGQDEYITWLLAVHGGFLAPGNIRAFDHAVRHMPEGGAMVEIGSFLGLSTNVIAYVAHKHRRPHPLFTCDPWQFEETGRPIGGYFDAGSPAFRDYARRVFALNAATFSADRKPHTIEARSDRFLELWARGAEAEDVFGRRVRLGGPVSFAYVDGAHDHETAKGDVDGLRPHLAPGAFLLLDDSADGAGFEGVTRVAHELARDSGYELVSKSPNYFFRRRH